MAICCARRGGAKILAKDTVCMFHSGGARPQSIHVPWHVRGLDSVSCWSVLPRMQLLRLGHRECLGSLSEPGAGGGGLLVCLQGWEMEESCDSEGWKLVFSGTRRGVCSSASTLATSGQVQCQHSRWGPRTSVHWNVCAGLAWAMQEVCEEEVRCHSGELSTAWDRGTPSVDLTSCLGRFVACWGLESGMLWKDCGDFFGPWTIIPCCSSMWAPTLLSEETWSISAVTAWL